MNKYIFTTLSFFVACVSSLAAFIYFLGNDADFHSWVFVITFYRIQQTTSWGFPIFFSLGFGLLSVLCAHIIFLLNRYRDCQGLRILEALLIAKLPMAIMALAVFYAARPPNFSLGIVVMGLCLATFCEFVLNFVIMLVQGRHGRLNWKQEISGSPLLTNSVLLVCGLIIALLLTETALRIYNPFTLRIKGDKIVLQTNYKYIINNKTPGKLEQQIVRSINSLGFRGEEPPSNFSNRLSIVAVGGSTTEDSSLSDDKTWVHVMKLGLDPSVKDLWVNNAGLAGHSTKAHRLLIDDYLAKLKPDIILFYIGINDLGKDGLGDESAQINSLEESVYRDKNNVRQLFERLADHSEVANLINNIYRRYQASKAGLAPFTLNLRGTIQRDKLYEPLPGEAENILREMPGALERYEQNVRYLIARARAIGAQSVLVTQPLLIGPGMDPDLGFRLDNIEQQLMEHPVSSLAYWQVLERYNDVLRHVGSELDIPVIDVAKKMEKRSAFFIDIMHYSVAGAERVGNIVAMDLCPWLAKNYPEHRGSIECRTAP